MITNIKEKPENYDDTGTNSLEEVDIFSKKYGYDETFVDQMLNPACKWKEKKEAFDNLTKITDQSKIKNIKNTDRTYFISMIKKLLKQPNINVVHSIINALNNISLGLNSNFSEAKDLYPYLIIFLKEKKDGIINSLITCLCNFALFINDSIINEKIIKYCTEKKLCNVAKINLCLLIENLIDKKNGIQLNNYVPLIIKIAKYLDDPNPEVREQSAKLMAFINFKKKEIFKTILNSINLDEKKKNKIEEYQKFYSNISCNNTNKKNVNISNKKSENKIDCNLNQKKFGKKLLDNDKSKSIITTNDNHIQSYNNNKNNKELILSMSNDNKIDIDIDKDMNINNSKRNNDNNNNLVLINNNSFFFINNKEEIIIYVQQKIGGEISSLFNSINWEERKDGFINLNNFFLDNNNIEEINNSYEYYFKYILINNQFFKDNNCFILNESINCLNTLRQKVKDFSKKYYKKIISLLVNILDEKKCIKKIINLLENLVLNTSGDEVISILINCLKDKSINIINKGIEIIKSIVNKSKSFDNSIYTEKKPDSKYSDISSIYNDNNQNSFNKSNKSQISKSPLLSTKKNMSKYNYNVVDVLPPEQGELSNYIKNIYDNNITNKNISLIEIKKILIHSIEKNTININQIKDIIKAFNNLLYYITKKIKEKKANIDNNEITLLRYLLDDYIFMANKKSLINNIEDSDIIYNSYEKLFLLLSSKEIKNINYGSDILGIVNNIILCLLTNFQKTFTIRELIKIISKYKSNTNDSLICSLSIKCLDKFIKILSKIQNQIDNNIIFVTIYDFFIDFERTNKNLETNNNDEQNALLIINSLISEYVTIYNNSIWEIYHKALDNNMLKMDIYFKRTIEILLKEINTKIIKNKNNNIFTQKITDNNSKSSDNEFIQEILSYVNELKTQGDKLTPEEQYNTYCEIVSILRINKINISILSNKIDGDIFSKIFELYYGINSNEESQQLSKGSATQTQTTKNIIQKNKNNEKKIIKKRKNVSPIKKDEKSKNEIKSKQHNVKKTNNNSRQKKVKEKSEQSKRIIEYNNKIKYLTESNKNRNQRMINRENNENIPMNNNIKNNTNNTNELVENTINKINEISLENKDENNNENNNCIKNEISAIEEISNMKKKLEEIRQKIVK